jgi:SAM-dependent methyltransferase
MNVKLLSILQSPDDGTPIQPDLTSEGGTKYQMTPSGILILDPKHSRPPDVIYSSPMFERWGSIVTERIQYYTGKQSVAGLVANWGYRNLRRLNHRPKGEWLLDIGCGDGAHIAHLNDVSAYIGLDRNMDRLEILKRNYPDATAIYGDAASLPFKSGSLRYIFSSNAFEHLWYLKDAVVELFRCMDEDGTALIIIPTEGGLWNLGRRFLSKPHFQKKYPDIDFEFISHIEHCNQASQVVRTLETFFDVRKKFVPLRVPSVMFNVVVELDCRPKNNPGLLRSYKSWMKCNKR